MRKLAVLLKPYRVSIVAALAFMLVELVVELTAPLLMARVINEGIVAENLSAVMYWGGIMVGLSLVGFAGGIINSFFASHVSQGFGYDLRQSMFKKIQSLSYAGFSRFPTATLITRMTSDVIQMQNVVFMGLRVMLRSPLMMLGGLVMALTVNLRLALILLVAWPFVLGFLIWAMNKGFKLFRRVQEKLDQTNGVLRENLLGIRLIKAFVRHDHEIDRFTKVSGDLMERTVAALRLAELTVPLLLLLMNSCVLIILWVGSRHAELGGANIGEVVAVVNYAVRITGAFTMFSWILMGLARAKASAGRIKEVLETDVDIQDHADDRETPFEIRKGKIEFDRVGFRFPGKDEPALDGISFVVEPGETVAVMGATGSGKSTLFQLIPRLYEASEGSVRIDGRDVKEIKLEELRGAIGYVPQEALLFTGTVRENLLWGKQDAAPEEIIAAAQDAQIHETIMRFPLQYETVLGQKGVNLSGGQKQRLSIARALIRTPKILLLDDCTSALDLQTEARLMAALRKYTCTTLIITQKISTAMRADKILLLEDGRLIAQGRHDELLAASPLYRKIMQSQFGKEASQHG